MMSWSETIEVSIREMLFPIRNGSGKGGQRAKECLDTEMTNHRPRPILNERNAACGSK